MNASISFGSRTRWDPRIPEDGNETNARGYWDECTHSGDGLHAEHEGVLGQVSGVAKTVLLPQLSKQVLLLAHGAEVFGVVALEEEVDETACVLTSILRSIGRKGLTYIAHEVS